jgi:hypothetical protein
MPLRSALFLTAVATVALAAPAHADLMRICAPEVAQFCGDVRRGNGRITACLASRRDALGPDCRLEIDTAAASRLVPAYARAVLGRGFRAELPPACAAVADRFCPGIPTGDGRIFACLYARSDRLDPRCTSAARGVLGR